MTPKDLNKLDEIYESMNQVYEIAENDLLIHTNLELFKGFRNSNWRDYQLSAKRKEAINNMLIKRGEDLLKGINNSTIKACEIADIPSAKFVKANQKAVNILIKSARTHYSSSVNKVWRLDKTTPLYNRILEQVNKGLDTGLRVQHKNGKSYEFKSYMEMNVRTAVSQEITEKQLELNEVAQNVFWVCNEFQDCAEDHKLLQGKIYYDNRWESFNIPDDVKKQISSFIKRKKLLSFQEVKEKPYWLTTRPNCRHLLTPITIKQAMGDIEQVKKDLKLSTGTYKDIKYKQSQKLRYCERNIRKYKAYVDQYEKIQAQSPNKETQAMINHYKSMVGKWQANARFVVRDANKDGKWLERDYERETRLTIIKDLGVKYNSRAGKPTPPKSNNSKPKPTPTKPKIEKPIPPKDKPLTQKQKDAVEYYVSGEGMWINSVLRKVGLEFEEAANLTEEDKKYLKELDDATNSQTVKQKKLYRSVDASAIFGKISTFDFENLESALIYNQTDKYSQKMKDLADKTIGKEILDKGFLSTTKDRTIAANWGVFTGSENPIVLEFNVPEGTKGLDAKEFEVADDPQKEVLLSRNQEYTIKDIRAEEIETEDEEGGKHKGKYIYVVADIKKKKEK